MQAQAQTLKHDVALLGFIYQNARMGITGINQIRGSVEDINFMNILNSQYSQYDSFIKRAQDELTGLGEKPEDISAFAKAGSFISTKFNTSVDKTVSHLAEMMIEETGMGTTKMIQKLNSMPDCTQQYKQLAQELIDYETKCIDELKGYL